MSPSCSPPSLPSYQMKDILKTEDFTIPEGVTVAIKSRIVKVTGPRGELTKNIRHINLDIQLVGVSPLHEDA